MKRPLHVREVRAQLEDARQQLARAADVEIHLADARARAEADRDHAQMRWREIERELARTRDELARTRDVAERRARALARSELERAPALAALACAYAYTWALRTHAGVDAGSMDDALDTSIHALGLDPSGLRETGARASTETLRELLRRGAL